MPEYVIIDNEKYKINTDFRYAMECDRIAQDENIGDFERVLAIIYTLFGDKGLENQEHYEKLLEYAQKFLSCGQEVESNKKPTPNKNDLDFTKCSGLITSSFKFDYQYDPYKEKNLHWYEFYNDLSNLSTSEFGTCCALNRVLSVLNQDASKIKDSNDRKALIELQNTYRAKYCVKHKEKHTKEQEEMANKVYKLFGLRKE